jgi:hypothetical protein
MASSERWHSDGTFDTAVNFRDDRFQQFYIIQSWYKSQMIPCVYALLTHKTKETYRNMIADLKDGAAKLKLKLNPVFFFFFKVYI